MLEWEFGPASDTMKLNRKFEELRNEMCDWLMPMNQVVSFLTLQSRRDLHSLVSPSSQSSARSSFLQTADWRQYPACLTTSYTPHPRHPPQPCLTTSYISSPSPPSSTDGLLPLSPSSSDYSIVLEFEILHTLQINLYVDIRYWYQLVYQCWNPII